MLPFFSKEFSHRYQEAKSLTICPNCECSFTPDHREPLCFRCLVAKLRTVVWGFRACWGLRWSAGAGAGA